MMSFDNIKVHKFMKYFDPMANITKNCNMSIIITELDQSEHCLNLKSISNRPDCTETILKVTVKY